jgi:hypothetical protein
VLVQRLFAIDAEDVVWNARPADVHDSAVEVESLLTRAASSRF